MSYKDHAFMTLEIGLPLNPSTTEFKRDYFQHFTSLLVNYERVKSLKKVPSNHSYGIAQVFAKIVVTLVAKQLITIL